MEYVFNESNFASEVLASPIPVLVDFFATWCGPCRMLAPTVEEIAREYEGRVKVGKVDVDVSPAIAQMLEIESIPTLILFKDGKPAGKVVGYVPKEKITEMF
ncbi:MAG: thioredoxin [Clostridia bacterium]|nr:thioredoxin [Clostridia bacterium]